MHKFLFSFYAVLISCSISFAQSGTNTGPREHQSYEYYIRIAGIDTRQGVLDLQNSISRKKGINFFMADRYPVRYFLMRSDHPIQVNEFFEFLSNHSQVIEFYGEGKKGREQAVLLYNKTKAR